MSLGWRALTVGSLAVAGLLIALVLVANLIVVRTLDAQDRSHTLQHLKDARSAVQEEAGELVALARVWAHRDDIYVALNGGNTSLIAAAVDDSALPDLGLNIVAFLDRSGRLLYGRSYDEEARQWGPLPTGLSDYLTHQGPLLKAPRLGSPFYGLISLKEGPLMVAARPALTSRGAGPSHGVVLLGRFLDRDELESIGQAVGVSVAVLQVQSPSPPRDLQSVLPLLLGGQDKVTQAVDGDTLYGYTLLSDITGSPALVLRVESDRPLLRLGKRIALALSLALGGTVVAFGLVGLVMGWRAVLRPLHRLAYLLEQRDEAPHPISPPGAEELDRIATAFNGLAARLQAYREDLRRAEASLEQARQELHLLEQVALVSLRPAEPRDLLQDLLGKLAEALQASVGVVCLPEDNGPEWEVACYYGLPHGTPLLTIPVGSEPLRSLTRGMARGAVVLPLEAYRPLPIYPALRQARMNCSVVAPLEGHEKVLGLLMVGGAWSEERARERALLVRVAAAQMGLAMENAQAHQALKSLAMRDPLTTTLNRQETAHALESEVARSQRTQTPLSILLVDIDHFHRINETAGPRVGDLVLQKVAKQVLEPALRAYDTVGRTGPDEFVILLPGASKADAIRVAERLHLRLATHTVSHPSLRELDLTFSIGVASLPEDGQNAEALLSKAEEALAFAKRSGGNRTVSVWESPSAT